MYREKEKEQQLIIKFGSIFYFLLFLLPGLDFRFGWSQVPFWLVIASEAGILFGYFFVFLAFKENAYAGRTVEIFEGQKVIESGPYAKVRHPMYVGVLLMFLFIPTALGSFWALLAFIPVAALIIYRIFNEEKVLSRDLAGYKEYMGKVKFRLMPGIW